MATLIPKPPYLGPAQAPCVSCPYRKDVPSGVWHADHYILLPQFDRPTFAQPPGVFLCHQQNGRLCAGWCGTHDMSESLGLRLAAASGRVSQEVAEEAIQYKSAVPLFETGAEAAAHGLRDIDTPGIDAVLTGMKIQKIHRNIKRRKKGKSSGTHPTKTKKRVN